MGLLKKIFRTKTPLEKEKEALLNSLSVSTLKKIIAKRKVSIDDYKKNKRGYIEAIIDSGVGLPTIKRYMKADKAISSRGKKLKPNYGNVRRVIESWRPEEFTTEPEFKKDLYNLFKKKMGHEFVRKESGEYHADIVIDRKIPIELKRNLGKSDLDRLDRQINNYKRDKNYRGQKIFIVICGIKDDDGYGIFKSKYKRDKRIVTIVKFKKELKKKSEGSKRRKSKKR